MQRTVQDDWTVSSLLAHVAFLDQSCVARWDHFNRTGSFIGLPDEVIDIVNAAIFPTWCALPAGTARLAAERADARIKRRPDDGLTHVESSGRQHHIERSRNRNEHLQRIKAFFRMT